MRSGSTRNGSADSAESPPPEKKSRLDRVLLFRVLSAVVFLPPFVIICLVGSIPFLLLVLAVALLATREAYRLLSRWNVAPLLPLGTAGVLALTAIQYRGGEGEMLLFLVFFFILALLAVLPGRGGHSFAKGAVALFILFYAGWLPSFLVLLRELPRSPISSYSYSEGGGFVFLLFLMVWGSDTGAYTVGRIAGRHPLAPSLSPKKTVEGGVGGLLFAVGGAFAARALWLPSLSAVDALLLGGIAGALSQVGDLVESKLKREAEVKDSGSLIPGHGGVLDRFDGIFFAAPFVYYYLRFTAGGG